MGIPPVEGRRPMENQIGWPKMLLIVMYTWSTATSPSDGTCPSVPSNTPVRSAKKSPLDASFAWEPNSLYITSRLLKVTFCMTLALMFRPKRLV